MELLWWITSAIIWQSVSTMTSSDVDGWISNENRLYKAFTAPLVFSEAKAACEAEGGYLANAETPEKNQYVRSLISDGVIWFGLAKDLSADAPPMTFYFVSGVAMTTYTPWEPNQPNNYKKIQECVHMETSGLWDDTQCYNSKAYVCEKDGSGLPYPCPDDYIVYDGYCYHQSEEAFTYWGAVSYCDEQNAPLLCYSNSEERENTQDMFSDNYWLGMVDREPADGTYSCIDDVSSPYVSWSTVDADCTGADEVYTYDKSDGMKCTHTSAKKKQAMCKKLACSYGWQADNGNCYQVVTTPASRSQAEAHCESLGAVLAAPTSHDNNMLITQMLGGHPGWLGVMVTGGVVSRTDSILYNYTNWGSTPPDTDTCGQLQADSTWTSTDCTGSAPYICAHMFTLPSYSVTRYYKLQEYKLAGYEEVTAAECAAECDRQVDPYKGRLCYSFSYRPSKKVCALNTNQPSSMVEEEVRIKRTDWNLYIYSEDVCDIPPDQRVPLGFHLVTSLLECLPLGYCLDGNLCYYPRNHMYDAGTSAIECPDGWIYFNNTCYRLNLRGTYYEAINTCRQDSAHLVTVHGQDHMDFIYQQFIRSERKVWLGLRYIADVWGWMDGGVSDFRGWGSQTDTESYIVVRTDSEGFWHGTYYTELNYPICAKAACPVGWRWLDENCHQMNYQVLPFDEALQVCRDKGSELAVPKSAQENEQLKDIANGAAIWLGYVHHASSGDWLRTDGWTGSYSDWITDSINVCGTMNTHGDWSPEFCDDVMTFICTLDYHIPGFLVTPGSYIVGHNLATYTVPSAHHCADKCLSYQAALYQTRCVSFDYNHGQNKCYLSGRSQETILYETDWRLDADFIHYERDIDVCSIPSSDQEMCDDVTSYEECLYAGCCWAGGGSLEICYKSRSSIKAEITCNEGCEDVIGAMMSGDDDVIEDTYYQVAYDDVIRLMDDVIPESFWIWLNQHGEVKKALLGITWPADPTTVYGFYELWDHVGSDRALTYHHLLIATAYNHRSWGLHTNPRFYRNPGYYHYLRSDVTHSVTHDWLAGLSRDQQQLISEEEDMAVTAANQQKRKKRSGTSVRECKITKEDKWYNGHHNVTETGHVCQAWISHYPNDHTKEPSTNDPDQFPDASIEDAGNYCRNPDDSKMPWCYIADPDGPPRRYCDIPMCSDTKQYCKFPFTSPYTGNVWYRCALEPEYDSDEFCLDQNDRLIECHHDFTEDGYQDDGCIFPFKWKETGETYTSCIGQDNPWCASRDDIVPVNNINDYRKYCLGDYGLTSSMYTWASVLENPMEMRAFTAVRDGFLSLCQDYFTHPDNIPFPPRDHAPNAFQAIDYYISKYEDSETGKFFNYFPTFTAEWPLLLHLNLDLPVVECDWVWERWMRNEKMIMYSHYSKQSLNNTDIICRPRQWAPLGSLIYAKEEGGVCGQQSFLNKNTGMCLGRPGNIVAQPAHLALFTIYHHPLVTDDILNGPYHFTGHQWVSNGEYNVKSGSTSGSEKHILTLHGQPATRVVNMDFESGIVHTMNQGYDVFMKGRSALNIFSRADDAGKESMLGYLVGYLAEAPYHTHIWYEIADFLTGSHWDVGGEALLYPLTCRVFPDLNQIRSRLQSLAETHFYDKRVYLHTYLTTVTRILYPASCCKQRPEYKDSLTSAYEALDLWKGIYGDHVRMHYLKCESVEGNFDQSAQQMLTEVLRVSGWSIENQEKERFVMFFDEAVRLFLDMSAIDLINFMEAMEGNIPHVEVGSSTWSVTVQYDHMTQELLRLYQREGLLTEADTLSTYKLHLTDKSQGSDISFWQDLADQDRLVGSYQLILDGIKKWDNKKQEFYIEF